MTNPAKNRLHDYEAGWLALLVKMGIKTDAIQPVAMLRRRNTFGQCRVDHDGDRGSLQASLR